MVDLLRVGGITQWLKVAGMAEAFNLPVVSHLIPGDPRAPGGRRPERPDGGVHALDAPLWQDFPSPVNGHLVIPDAPGLGLTFDQDALARYELS